MKEKLIAVLIFLVLFFVGCFFQYNLKMAIILTFVVGGVGLLGASMIGLMHD